METVEELLRCERIPYPIIIIAILVFLSLRTYQQLSPTAILLLLFFPLVLIVFIVNTASPS